MTMQPAQNGRTTICEAEEVSTCFEALPDESRVWPYLAERNLHSDEIVHVASRLDAFFRDWASHGREVTGASAIVDQRIVLIVAHIPSGDISGCGIDKSVHVVEQALREVGSGLSSPLDVAYRAADGQIDVASRPEFRSLVRQGVCDGNTLVYDLTVQNLGDLRAGRFIVPATEAWHAKVFALSTAPVE